MALAVAAGIFLSRIAGLVRERVFAHYLGNSEAAGAFRAALRIPNLLQNLFGEGALSASFIPVYARLLAEGKREEAGAVAGVIVSLLVFLVGILVFLGVALSRPLINLLAPGFEGEVRELTVTLVRIMFPGTGLLVLSAWCLGVLNSHRKFFLAYVAPVLWNIAIIAALVAYQGDVIKAAWGTVAGAVLQLLVQVPKAIKLNAGLWPSLKVRLPGVQTVLGNFAPALVTRGVVQISAYIDQVLSSFLGPQAVAAMAYAQTLYLLPISLFGMAISSAELPEMSSATGTPEQIATALRTRLAAGLKRLAFLIAPSTVAFILLGDVVVSTLFQTGSFSRGDAHFVWLILAGSALGLLAATQARLLVSALWALRDTRTPLRFALLRVTQTAISGVIVVFPLRRHFDLEPAHCAALLTAASAFAGWVEFFLVRRKVREKLGALDTGAREKLRYVAAAIVSALPAIGLKNLLPPEHPLISGALCLALYGASYLLLTWKLGSPEAAAFVRRLRGAVSR